MMYLSNTEAPSLHIEPLPSNAIGVAVSVLIDKKHGNCLDITCWAPRESGLFAKDCINDEEFIEDNCYDCEWYVESLEIDLSYEDFETTVDGQDVYIYGGTGYASSPCHCHEEGLGAIEFPCLAGHDGPSGQVADFKLRSEYLSYGILINDRGTKAEDYCVQQGLIFEDGVPYVTDTERSINTFERERSVICWGGNTEPKDLLMIEQVYSQSFANQDLLSYEAHDANAGTIQDAIEAEEVTPQQHIIPVKWDGRPMALAVASAINHLNAFMYMTVSCAHTNG